MKRLLVVALIGLTLLSLVVVLIPVILIRPFTAQTFHDLEMAYVFRRHGPWLTLLFAALGFLVSVTLARRLHSKWARGFILAAVALQIGLAVLSRQNHFEWIFHGLKEPAYTDVKHSNHIHDTDMVLAVHLNGDAKAFPVSLMAYHHVVNTTVGREPIVVTY